MKPLVETLIPVIAPLLDRPFVLFGYSLGAAIAFETARGIRRETGADPLGLFACARRGPQLEIRHPPRHLLDDAAFKKVLRQLGGTPEEALANDELMDVLLPLLRADFELTETYVSAELAASASTAPELDKLCCPVQVYGGKGDVRRDPFLCAPPPARDSPRNWRIASSVDGGPVESSVI
jgi:surfactin synthase thioesterase subunit